MSRQTERSNVRGTRLYKVLTETYAGPASYTTGGNQLQSTIFRMLERATCLQITGGYIGEVVTGSVSGNVFLLKVHAVTGSNSGAQELASGWALNNNAITVLEEGF